MVMTVHKLTANGYTYLTRQVAGGDVERERGQDSAAYYTAKGNPPGRWMGRGAPLLGLAGRQVTEQQMLALFGEGRHPDAEQITSAYLAAHLRPDLAAAQVAEITRQAGGEAHLGNTFPEYEPIEAFDIRVSRRLAVIEKHTGRNPTSGEIKKIKAEESRRARAAVAGYDAVFTPVKSASLIWALDPRPQVRTAVREAHEAARDAALQLLEDHAAYTRTGKGGVAQIETTGLIAACFDHYDSRAGDPNLHTHVAISAKVQGTDGKWRSLDARPLYAMIVAASEFYNTRFEAEIVARLPGVTFTVRPDSAGSREPIREISGVPAAYIEHFSARRTDIEARYQQLLREYRREHQHDPSRSVCHRLARQATLDTRDPKKTLRSLAEMRTDWTQSLTDTFGAQAVAALATAIPSPAPGLASPAPDPKADITSLVAQTIANVAEMRSTWTIWNVRAEAERLIRASVAPGTPRTHQELAGKVVAAAISPAHSICTDPPALLNEPGELRRSDGQSVFTQHATARYTSTLILDAEARLVSAARTATAVAIPGNAVAASLRALDAVDAAGLDPGQLHLVTAFATSNRLLVVGLGAAGTGKTTAMRAYAYVTRQAGQRVIPLAPSAAAAAVLGAEVGLRAENLHKFLHEHTRGPHATALASGAPVPAGAAMFTVRPGDVILVDEAGMAGTLALDRLITIAERHGAVVRLLGDYRQIGAVESGGALRLIATEAGAAELSVLYRFTNPSEAAATLKLRTGDTTGLDFYQDNDRIVSGSRQAMIEAAYTAWKHDMLAGKVTLMAAASTANVTELAAQARRDRVEAGQVQPAGVTLADGNLAGAGDWITTRHNDRTLATARGRDWVKNGDGWTVTARHPDGSLTARHLNHRGTVRLPAAYVARHVELLYATTTNRAQGSTVDTAHPLITPGMTRENLYVIISRARERTVLHVVTHDLPAYDTDEQTDQVKNDPRQYAAREILENILSREGNELSATQTIAVAQQQASSLATLAPRHQHAATLRNSARYTSTAAAVLGTRVAAALTADPDWPTAVAALTRGETRGWQPGQLLAACYRTSVQAAEHPGRLLAWLIDTRVRELPPPPPLCQPTPADAARYAQFLRTLITPHGTPLIAATAIQPPAVLSAGSRAREHHHPVTHVPAQTLSQYAHTTAQVLGITTREITQHRSWPHLAAALAASERNGISPADLLTLAARATRAAESSPAREPDHLSRASRTARHLLIARGLSPAELTIPSQLRHSVTATAVLGIRAADRARHETAWPALTAALTRTEHAGHDPRRRLAEAAAARELNTAKSLSEVLAVRLAGQLAAHPAPPSSHRDDDTWRALAWTLKGIETRGHDPSAALAGPTGRGTMTIHDVLQLATQAAPALPDRTLANPAIPPWLTPPTACDLPSTTLSAYLNHSADLIAQRVTQLTTDLTTAPPAWLTALGILPPEHARYPAWQQHVSVIAAYRDQHQITADDPVQVLGPFIEPGRPEQHAYHIAVQSVLAAHDLALPGEPSTPPADPATARVAADIYLSLPDAERADITARIASRLGTLWLGNPALDDETVTNPAYTRQLHDALAGRGHISVPEPGHPAGERPDRGRDSDSDRPLEISLAEHHLQFRNTVRTARRERATHDHRQHRTAAREPGYDQASRISQGPLLNPEQQQTRGERRYET
jgi:conjugative relaxase-like TrwC/TraI family protein